MVRITVMATAIATMTGTTTIAMTRDVMIVMTIKVKTMTDEGQVASRIRNATSWEAALSTTALACLPVSRRKIACLLDWKGNFSATELFLRDCRNACSHCQAHANHVCHVCRENGRVSC